MKQTSTSSAIKVIFETKTVDSFLSNKCKRPKNTCHGCDTQYIGQTKRDLRTRVAEHRQRSRESAVKDHGLTCDTRKKQIDTSEFKIIKNEFATRSLRLYYEAITIKKSYIETGAVRRRLKNYFYLYREIADRKREIMWVCIFVYIVFFTPPLFSPLISFVIVLILLPFTSFLFFPLCLKILGPSNFGIVSLIFYKLENRYSYLLCRCLIRLP